MAQRKDDGKQPTGAQAQPPQNEPQPEAQEEKLDIVDQAGKESFPASDPPPWTP